MCDVVRELFADWNNESINIRHGDGGQTVRIALGIDLVNTSPANGGNTASSILNALLTYPNLEVTTDDGGVPNWEYLLRGGDIVIEATKERVPSWYWMLRQPLPRMVTVADIVMVTGLGTSTVRERLRRWVRDGYVEAVSGCGEHLALAYPSARVCELVSGRRSGNRTTGKVRSLSARKGHETRRRRMGERLA